ncbi:MAG: hypothetical protein K8S97_09325 [Anaerolineae bacterium]|nr:hypothetical protein [Anaerolineae bacterium]
MSEGTSLFFDLIAVVFLALTVIVLVLVFGIVSGTMDPPILAPATDVPLPTEVFIPTYTPSPGPGTEQPTDADLTLTPVETPAPDAQ